MTYEHTQRGALHHVLIGIAVLLAILSSLAPQAFGPPSVWLFIIAPIALVSLCFTQMTVRDEGEHLAIRYGIIPLFRGRIRYAAMKSVEPARSAFIDGWGIHYILGRGLIYNLWGKDCVRITTTRGVVRVGTDDVEGLVDFLENRIREHSY